MEASWETRSRACAISIFQPCAPGGGPYSGVKRRSLCRGTCLAYRLQAERLGDLDKETVRLLERIASGDGGLSSVVGKQSRFDRLQPGSTLVREWDGARQRVEVLDRGFAWNGKTYRSLSAVAFAITGTRWSGPRFFGLRGRSEGQS